MVGKFTFPHIHLHRDKELRGGPFLLDLAVAESSRYIKIIISL